ncbi:CTLH domain-containing protein [Mycena venus]|uniref:CTLH domain-containing protein n=1 Tax=Mycena venus TaxID=2733690 RepID=A0A8H6YV81_9AGAR|nr:CTLH domain-containing protein [Mycena venus]
MSPHSLNTHDLINYTRVGATTLRDISDSFSIPFLSSVAGIILWILETVQTVKSNKERCFRMIERIHQIMCAIINISFTTKHGLSPKVLDIIGVFAIALQKFQGHLRSYRDSSMIGRLFRKGEISAQLDACETKFKEVLDCFQTQNGADLMAAIMNIELDTGRRHQELLKLLGDNDSMLSGDSSSIRRTLLHLGNSSSALSILPAQPKIFHGRESEVRDIVEMFLSYPARIAILGTGGIGKTTLAIASLHDPEVISKYRHRYFISCDSAHNHSALLATFSSHLQIEPSRHLARDIVQYFSEKDSALLVLDNLETAWEPRGSRAEIEELLSLLTDVPDLSLLITMRGAERPGKVKWSRPFIAPLHPLSEFATRQTFIDIADEPGDEVEEKALAELVRHSGCLALAVTLMARVAALEGYSSALACWLMQRTALLSEGDDKRSNLDISIMASISSPRFQSVPGSMQLLALLSILPDGIHDDELLHSEILVTELSQCKSTLLRTSLAYSDTNSRLKMLSPIRECVRAIHPPDPELVRQIRAYMHFLLQLWKTHRQLPSGDLVRRLTANLGNIHDLLLLGLDDNQNATKDVIRDILILDGFSRAILKGHTELMTPLPALLESLGDSDLWLRYSASHVEGQHSTLSTDIETLVQRGLEIAQNPSTDQHALTEFYNAIGLYYARAGQRTRAEEFLRLAMSLAEKIGDPVQQCFAIQTQCDLQTFAGNLQEGIMLARQGQRLAQAIGDFHAESLSLLHEARTQFFLGRPSVALSLCATARDLVIHCGLDGSDTYLGILDTEAEIHQEKTEYREARLLHEEAIRLTSPTRAPFFHAHALTKLAWLDITIGSDDEKIFTTLEAARSVATRFKWPFGLQHCDYVAACAFLRRAEVARARDIFEIGVFLSRDLNMGLLSSCVEQLGNPAHGMYEADKTFRWAVVYLALGCTLKTHRDIHQALRYLGDLFSMQGDDQSALNIFEAVLQASTELDVHRSRADCMLRIGNILMKYGDIQKGKQMWRDARPLFIRSAQVKCVEDIDRKLLDIEPQQN